MDSHDYGSMEGYVFCTFDNNFRVVVVYHPIRDLTEESIDQLQLHGGQEQGTITLVRASVAGSSCTGHRRTWSSRARRDEDESPDSKGLYLTLKNSVIRTIDRETPTLVMKVVDHGTSS